MMQSAEQEIIRLASGFKAVIPEWKIHAALEYISLGEVDLAFHILCDYIIEYAPQISPADYQTLAAINAIIHEKLTKNTLAALKGKIRFSG